MSTSLDWDKWIFVNYVPGSFGSFLGKVIETSPAVRSYQSSKVFDQDNASHENIISWIRQWHHGDELDYWASLDYQQRQNYLDDNLNHELINSDPMGARMHRLTVPRLHHLFRQHWPHSKFINISVCNQYLDLVVDQMAKKTLKTWLWNLPRKDLNLSKLMQKVEHTDQLKYYRKLCVRRIDSILSPTVSDCLDFPVVNFTDPKLFTTNISRVFDFLGIEPGSYKSLYQEFYQLHKGFEEYK